MKPIARPPEAREALNRPNSRFKTALEAEFHYEFEVQCSNNALNLNLNEAMPAVLKSGEAAVIARRRREALPAVLNRPPPVMPDCATREECPTSEARRVGEVKSGEAMPA